MLLAAASALTGSVAECSATLASAATVQARLELVGMVSEGPLFALAVAARQRPLVELALAAGADVNAPDEAGRTPCMLRSLARTGIWCRRSSRREQIPYRQRYGSDSANGGRDTRPSADREEPSRQRCRGKRGGSQQPNRSPLCGGHRASRGCLFFPGARREPACGLCGW
jgi:hypothetical protein